MNQKYMKTQPPYDFSRFFDRVLVISLSRATDRQASVKKQLAPGSFDWIWAVDKRTLETNDATFSGQVDPAASRRNHPVGKTIQPGEVAVSLSHRLAYETMLKNNWKSILILEDDFVVDANKIGLLESMYKELPPDWDVWYLGFDKRSEQPRHWFLKKNFYLLLNRLGLRKQYAAETLRHFYPQPWSAHLRTAGFHDCLHAYAVSRRAAESLFLAQRPVRYVADHLVAHQVTDGTLGGFISMPPLIHQPEQLSKESVFSYRKND